MKDALANLTERGAAEPVVKLTVALTESGFAGVQDAVLFGEIKDEGLIGKVKDLFGGGAKDEPSPEADADADVPLEASTSSAPPVPTKKASTKDAKDAKDEDTIPLHVDVRPLSIPALEPSELRQARDR